MIEYCCAQHGIHAVTGVQNEILAHPAEERGKQHKHCQSGADLDQRALGAVRHDLIDDGLGEQWSPKRKQLDDEGGEQHITPHALVLQQLRDEPVETKLYLTGPCAIGILDSLRLQCQLKRGAGKTYRELGLS